MNFTIAITITISISITINVTIIALVFFPVSKAEIFRGLASKVNPLVDEVEALGRHLRIDKNLKYVIRGEILYFNLDPQ